MEKIMTTADHLKHLEERLVAPSVRRDPTQVAPLLADDFREFGSSGRVFDKATILEDLQNELTRPASLLSDFASREISPTTVLLTYKATRRSSSGETIGQSWRSSLWVCLDGAWQIIFHQGTPIPQEALPPKK
jgi:hypothetical protein